MGDLLSSAGYIKLAYVAVRCKFTVRDLQCALMANDGGYCPRHEALVRELGSEVRARHYEIQEYNAREAAAKKQAKQQIKQAGAQPPKT